MMSSFIFTLLGGGRWAVGVFVWFRLDFICFLHKWFGDNILFPAIRGYKAITG